MSADVSSSSKPDGVCITATTSLDGVLLSCSENVASLTELMGSSFDTLILTLKPVLEGTNSPPPLLEQSVHFTLRSQEPSQDGLRLTYTRHPAH